MPTVGQTTLATLRAAAVRRADFPTPTTTTFVTTAEWNEYVAGSAKELYDILVSKYGDDWYLADPYSFSTDGTTERYSMPSDMYKLRRVEMLAPGQTTYLVLDRRELQEVRSTTSAAAVWPYGVTRVGYTPIGTSTGQMKLWLSPLVGSGHTVRVWYVPRPATPTADTDVVDGVAGWEEYVVVDAAIKARVKQESDVGALMAQKAALLARIEAMAANRDAGRAHHVVSTNGGWPDLAEAGRVW